MERVLRVQTVKFDGPVNLFTVTGKKKKRRSKENNRSRERDHLGVPRHNRVLNLLLRYIHYAPQKRVASEETRSE